MKSSKGLISISDLVSEMEGKTDRKTFINTMGGKGIHSAKITIKRFAFGEIENSEGLIYRRFYYNKYGQVVKKFSYTPEGEIELKESYRYGRKGQLLRSKFTTENSLFHETYVYHKSDGYLRKYYFWNNNWPHTKKENYDVEEYTDDNGEKGFRKVKKTSIGLLGTPELITHYIYDNNTNKYRFRYVTHPDGKLIITFLYTNDDKGNNIGLYGFELTP